MTITETPLIKLSLSKNSKYLIDTNILCMGGGGKKPYTQS